MKTVEFGNSIGPQENVSKNRQTESLLFITRGLGFGRERVLQLVVN